MMRTKWRTSFPNRKIFTNYPQNSISSIILLLIIQFPVEDSMRRGLLLEEVSMSQSMHHFLDLIFGLFVVVEKKATHDPHTATSINTRSGLGAAEENANCVTWAYKVSPT
jgi:hypothetical protein